MADKQSVQTAAADAHTPLKAHELQGRVRIAFFNYVCATFAQNETLELCRIPPGARIITGQICTDGLAGSTVLDVGSLADIADPDTYLDAENIGASATVDELFATLALGKYTDVTTVAGGTIVAKLTGAAATDAKIIKGHVLYVID